MVGISKQALYTRQWREDEQFQEALEIARAMAADTLEDEAWRRAVTGVQRPVGWYKGEVGGYLTEYSDALLIQLLKGHMPSRYTDRVELKGALANLDVSKLPDHLVASIASGEHPMAVLASASSAILEGEDGV